MKVGGWLVLQGMENYPILGERIQERILEGMAKKNVQQDFRLVVLVRGENVSEWMGDRAVKLRVKEQQDFKENVLDCYKRRFYHKHDKRYYNTAP